MKVTGESRIILRTNCLSANISNQNPTVSVLGLNMGLGWDRPATNSVSKSTDARGL